MSSLAQIRAAIKNTLRGSISGLNVYEAVEDVIETPAAVISLHPKETADFNGAMGRGLDHWNFVVHIFLTKREGSFPQAELDRYLEGGGDRSIRQALFHGIGLDDTAVVVTGVTNYGAKHAAMRIESHVGATVNVCVRTSGT